MTTPRRTLSSGEIEATAAEWIGRRDLGLTPGDQMEFERWLGADERHRAALAELESTWQALERPRLAGTSALLALELTALRRRRGQRRAAGFAALLLLGAGFLATRPTMAPDTAVVLTSERRALPDGSVVEYPAGTQFTVEFSPTVRRVSLQRGDAHFQVAKDAARPFQVTAGGVDVRAVGTAFALQYSGLAVDVLVTEGRVTVGPVRSEASVAKSDPALVAAGHRVTMEGPDAAKPEVLAVTEAEIDERLAWRKPRVEFSGTPLAKVVALLNRHNDLRIVIDDPALEATPLSGVFRLNDTEAFVRILERGLGVRAERRGRDIVLHRVP